MALNAVVWILRSGFITCPRTGFFCCFVSCRPEFFEKSTTFWITERWFSLGEPTLSHVVGARGQAGPAAASPHGTLAGGRARGTPEPGCALSPPSASRGRNALGLQREVERSRCVGERRLHALLPAAVGMSHCQPLS